MTLASWAEYLKKGGKLIWSVPRISQIKYWIKHDAPCIINVNTAALNRYHKNWDNGHFLIVSGFKDDKIYVLDPDLPSAKAHQKIENELLLPAWAINAERSSGYMLIIRKDDKL